jgi:methyl-accepting chemotaxis protein
VQAPQRILPYLKNCVDKAGKGSELTNKCKESLHGIVDNVKKSTDNTKEALQEIVTNVEKVTTLTNQISNESCEQSDGVNSVNESIQQIDTVTQQNATTAEEIATTSEEMSAQAQTLLELINNLESHVSGNKKSKLTGRSAAHQYVKIDRNGDHGETQNMIPESVITMK